MRFDWDMEIFFRGLEYRDHSQINELINKYNSNYNLNKNPLQFIEIHV